jgi:hypothetical protein
MKKHLEYLNHLNSLNGLIDIDDFYTITFTQSEISLQGKITSQVLMKYSALFNLEIQDNGFILGKALLDGVTIRMTLT